MKKKQIPAILLITLSFLIASCKDNSVAPKPPITIDSSDIYDWKVITSTYPMRGLFVADSNNIFINSYGYKPLFYNGNTIEDINLHDPAFIYEILGGYDKNNVIFGGSTEPYGNPVIKKWTNGSLTSYTIGNDSGTSIADILMVGPDQAWISSAGRNKVYYFNSGSFTRYMLDDSVQEGRFFINSAGQLYVFGLYVENRNPNPAFIMLYTYKFNNNQFQLILRDSLYPHSDKTDYLLKCGTDMFMITHPDMFDQLYLFNGSSWEYYITAPKMISNVGGTSKDYFVMFSASNLSAYIWNGNWRKEDSLKFSNIPPFYSLANSSIIIKDDDVYFTEEDWEASTSFLIIGKKKIKLAF